jgi:protein ImuB
MTVERLLVVWCPRLLQEQEHGREARAFGRVVAALGELAARVDPVRPGVCAVPTRGPSRYFGGDEALAGLVAGVVAEEGPGIGVADGLFAAVLAARSAVEAAPGTGPVVVPPGGTPAFLAPWPVAALDRPELIDLLVRLGIRTLGQFAALPGPRVLARFGTEGAVCHRVAGGIEGELPGLRLFSPPRPGRGRPDRGHQRGFWGDRGDADIRAAQAVARAVELLHPEAVVQGRLQGGRGPAERARLVPWGANRNGRGAPGRGPDETGTVGSREDRDGEATREPWPGQVPPPAPAVVLTRPLPALLTDITDQAIGVTGSGMATAVPALLSVAGGAWVEVTGWAGPWPSDERWWSPRRRRRQARMQVVTAGGTAHLLTCERGGWWLEGIYD